LEGNERFQDTYRKYVDKIPSKPRKRLAIITCTDVRLNPIRIFHLSVGDAYILRNAGNVITDDMVRSLAAVISDISEIIVLGHTDCSLVNTPSIPLAKSDNILSTVLNLISGSSSTAIGGASDEKTNVKTQATILRANSAIPPRIPIHGLLFNVKSGTLKIIVNGYRNLPKIRRPPKGFSLDLPALKMPSISLTPPKKRTNY
jgi:carbonic anhydrase